MLKRMQTYFHYMFVFLEGIKRIKSLKIIIIKQNVFKLHNFSKFINNKL